MFRGTTASISFSTKYEASEINLGYITFRQNGVIVLDKEIHDDGVVVSDYSITVNFTQEETLLFSSVYNSRAEVQLRLIVNDTEVIATDIKPILIKGIIKDGVIGNEFYPLPSDVKFIIMNTTYFNNRREIFISENGIDWKRIDSNYGIPYAIEAMAYGSGKFATNCINSTDGITWQNNDSNSDNVYDIVSMVYGQDRYGNEPKFVAMVAKKDYCVFSTTNIDGVYWQPTSMPDVQELDQADRPVYWNVICKGPDYIAFCSSDTAGYYTISDMGDSGWLNWYKNSALARTVSAIYVESKNRYYAVQRQGTICSSYNGTTWIQDSECNLVSLGVNIPRKILYGNDIFVLIDKADIYYSYDGTNWTKSDQTIFNSSNGPRILMFGSGMFIVCSIDGKKIAYSYDGINWTETSLPLPTHAWNPTLTACSAK